MSMTGAWLGEKARKSIRGMRATGLDILDPVDRPPGSESGLFTESQELTLCGAEYDFYEPGQAEKTFIIIPDLSLHGEREPRMVNLARAMAERGIRVAIPRLPGLSQCGFSFIDVDTIVDLAIELNEKYGHKIGVIAFRFGAGLAARAIYEKVIRNITAPLILICPYYSLQELWRRLGRRFSQEPADDDPGEWDSFLWFRMLAAYRQRDVLGLDDNQVSELSHILMNYREQGLTDRKLSFYRLLLSGREGFEAEVFRMDPSLLGDLSPSATLEVYPGRVVMVLDERERLIPPSHSKRILAELEERGAGCRARIVLSTQNGHGAGGLSRLVPRISPLEDVQKEIFRKDPDEGPSKAAAGSRTLKRAVVFAMILIVALPVIWYRVFIENVPTVTPEQARLAAFEAGEGAVLVDTRSTADYNKTHVTSSVSWPYESIAILDSADQVPERFRNKSIYMFCYAGLTSAMAVAHLQKLGLKDVYNVRGGLMEWYGATGGECPTGLCKVTTAGKVQDAPLKLSTPLEQWLITAVRIVIRPLYVLLILALIMRLKGMQAPGMTELKWGLVIMLAGASFSAANYFFPGRDSYFLTHLYHSSLALGLGFMAFAFFRVISWRSSGQGEETIQQKPGGSRGMIVSAGAAVFIAALVPVEAQYFPASYPSTIMGKWTLFTHPMLYQMYEFRFAPLMAMMLAAIAAVAALGEKDPQMPRSKALLAGSIGFLALSYGRLLLFAMFKEDLVWFQAWEEIFKLLLVLLVSAALWSFRERLSGESSLEGHPALARDSGPEGFEAV